VLSWRCPVYRWREFVVGAARNRRTCRLVTVSARVGLGSHRTGGREDPKRSQP